MAITGTQFKAVFAVTDEQITKVSEWQDAVNPKTDEVGDPVATTLDDVAALMLADFKGKYDHWKRDVTAVEEL